MTDQPTTWTPERALAMLRDWRGDSFHEFNAKWPGVDDADGVAEGAIAALESAAAEIAKLRAELAAKQPAEAEAAQQGPSDEEIESAIDSIRRHRLNPEDAFIETYHALRKVARRAGVKL